MRNILLRFDVSVNRAVKKEKVEEFISKLHPRNSRHDLIRLGPEFDGGYLVPNDLENIEACFSPGADIVSDFKRDCSERGMDVYLADASAERPVLDKSMVLFAGYALFLEWSK